MTAALKTRRRLREKRPMPDSDPFNDAEFGRIAICSSSGKCKVRPDRHDPTWRASGHPRNGRLPVPQTQSEFHPHVRRNAFGCRDVRPQSRSFALWNQSLRPSPNSNRLSLRLSAINSQYFILRRAWLLSVRTAWLSLTVFSARAKRRVSGSADHSGADRTSDRAGAAQE